MGKDPSQLLCQRNSLSWKLDLNEGIDLSIFLFGYFERDTTQAFQKVLKPGMHVLDIGANIGAHTLPIAKQITGSGKVYAIEPTDWAFHKLQENLNLNPALTNAHTHQVLLTNNPNAAPKAIDASWRVDCSEIRAKSIESASPLSLDEFVALHAIEKIDVIKMDVDGNEVDILKSGTQALKKYKPIMIIELCPHVLEAHGTSLNELLNLLNELGYELYDLSQKRKLPTDTKAVTQLIPAGGSINAIAQNPHVD